MKLEIAGPVLTRQLGGKHNRQQTDDANGHRYLKLMQSRPENGMINGVKDSKCVGNLLDSHASRKARIQKANLKVQEAGHCKLAVLARHCRSQELRPFQAS